VYVPNAGWEPPFGGAKPIIAPGCIGIKGIVGVLARDIGGARVGTDFKGDKEGAFEEEDAAFLMGDECPSSRDDEPLAPWVG